MFCFQTFHTNFKLFIVNFRFQNGLLLSTSSFSFTNSVLNSLFCLIFLISSCSYFCLKISFADINNPSRTLDLTSSISTSFICASRSCADIVSHFLSFSNSCTMSLKAFCAADGSFADFCNNNKNM